MVNKKKKCPTCGRSPSIWEETDKYHPIFKKIWTILMSKRGAYSKKIALLNCLKEIESEKLEPSEEARLNCLIQSKLYAELAKESMREYKKMTVKEYSKKE